MLFTFPKCISPILLPLDYLAVKSILLPPLSPTSHLIPLPPRIVLSEWRWAAQLISKRVAHDPKYTKLFIGVDRYFSSGREKMLITTIELARGIDVATDSIVINYDIPLDLLLARPPAGSPCALSVTM